MNALTPEVVRTPMMRRLADWLDLPDWDRLFAWPEWPALFGAEERIRVEEEIEGDELVIRAELPGIDPDKDAEITVADNVLTIKAERKKEFEEKKPGTFRSEFRYGSFMRRMPLPRGAKVEDVKASYRDGILEVRVPVPSAAEEPAGKRIEITKG